MVDDAEVIVSEIVTNRVKSFYSSRALPPEPDKNVDYIVGVRLFCSYCHRVWKLAAGTARFRDARNTRIRLGRCARSVSRGRDHTRPEPEPQRRLRADPHWPSPDSE